MMSATVLDSKAFCQSLGLAHDEVKFIQVGSDFPSQNRPIYPLNIAYLNFKNLQLPEVKTNIAMAIDNLMTRQASVAQFTYSFVPYLSVYIFIATNMLYNDAFMTNSLVML